MLLAAGGGAYFFLFCGIGEGRGSRCRGTFVPLDPVAVNLAGGGYLKVGVALQLTADGAPAARRRPGRRPRRRTW